MKGAARDGRALRVSGRGPVERRTVAVATRVTTAWATGRRHSRSAPG